MVEERGGSIRLSVEERRAVRALQGEIEEFGKIAGHGGDWLACRDALDDQLWQLQLELWSHNGWDWYWKARAGILNRRSANVWLVRAWDLARLISFLMICGLSFRVGVWGFRRIPIGQPQQVSRS
jgi:hypothetical protein